MHIPERLFEIKDESLAKGGVPGAMGGGGADVYLGWGRPGPLLGLVSSPVKRGLHVKITYVLASPFTTSEQFSKLSETTSQVKILRLAQIKFSISFLD